MSQTCEYCLGTGIDEDADGFPINCEECQGTGVVMVRCNVCDGTGFSVNDDDEPITVEWLESLGNLLTLVDGTYYSEHHGLLIDPFRGKLRLWCGGSVVTNQPTRGDVRRLCRGLRIELKEGGK